MINAYKSITSSLLQIYMSQQIIESRTIPDKGRKTFNKFSIPPNFALARFHAQSCKLYKTDINQLEDVVQNIAIPTCPCCMRKKGNQKISLCENQQYMQSIAEQVPLFFSLRYLLVLLIILIIFVKVAEFVFQCDQKVNRCQLIKYSLKDSFGYNIQIPLGYVNLDDRDFMVQVIIYSIAIFMIKFILKRKKYRSRKSYGGIQRRSVELINLSKLAKIADIQKLFQGFLTEDITFTYKIKEYHQKMSKMHKLQKKMVIYNTNLTKQSKHKKSEKNQQIKNFNQHFKSQITEVQDIKGSLVTESNRTSVAYVVLNSKAQKDKVLKKFGCNWFTKLFYKLFPKCSNSSIHNQHISINDAPAPDDIIWQNLGQPYIQTKMKRFCSFFISSIILVFGMVSQIFVINSKSYKLLESKITTTITVFIINFLIINFLEWTTHQIQMRKSATAIKLSLIRKITFFMFVNISITPYILFIYEVFDTDDQDSTLSDIGFQILLIALSNCFKPFLTLLSVQRIVKWIKSTWEQSKENDSSLNQIQANKLFEPLDFPIQIYYSIVYTSLMTMFFYMSFYQILIIIQLFALLLLFFIAKWMLIRVCKKPTGISLKLNNLAQNILKTYVLFYWMGFYLTKYLNTKKYQQQNFIQFSITKNIYTIISVCCVAGFFIISDPLIAIVAQKLQSTSQRSSILEGFMGQNIVEGRTYKQANIGFTVNGQSYSEMKSRLAKLANQILNKNKK